MTGKTKQKIKKNMTLWTNTNYAKLESYSSDSTVLTGEPE